MQTSQAVKSCMTYVENNLLYKYNHIFNSFYDINKDYAPQFQQFFAKVKYVDRAKPWIACMYSFDNPKRSSLINRTFTVTKTIGTAKRPFLLKHVTNSVVFSIITNDGDYADRVSEDIASKVDWSFTTTFNDLMWPLRLSEANYTKGSLVRPTTYNGFLYESQSNGKTSKNEPIWPTTLNSTITDGTIVWKTTAPKVLKCKVSDFVVSDIQQDDYEQSGIRYKIDFGGEMFYQIFQDTVRGDGYGGKGLIWVKDDNDVLVPYFDDDYSWNQYALETINSITTTIDTFEDKTIDNINIP